jgi:CheY-like chemotaxis protein
MHVLIVEDNAVLRRTLARTIRGFGLATVEAGSSPAALALLTLDERVGVVLLDINLPGADGISVLEAIRATPALEHVKVLMCTAADDLESALLAVTGGAAAYLVKPIAVETLRERLTALGALPAFAP